MNKGRTGGIRTQWSRKALIKREKGMRKIKTREGRG